MPPPLAPEPPASEVRISFAALGAVSIIVGVIAGGASALLGVGVARGQESTRLEAVEKEALVAEQKATEATVAAAAVASKTGERMARLEALAETVREDLRRIDAKLDRALERGERK